MEILEFILGLIVIAFYCTAFYTCIRIIRYINMREDEEYKKAMYQQARRDLQDIDDQLNRKP